MGTALVFNGLTNSDVFRKYKMGTLNKNRLSKKNCNFSMRGPLYNEKYLEYL